MDILSFIMGLKKGKSSVKLQEKTVTPSESEIVVLPDETFDALSKVTVEAVQSSGGSSDEWVGAKGNFMPTSGTYTVAHNLGIIPDIVFLNISIFGSLSTTSLNTLCGCAISGKLLGSTGEETEGYGYVFTGNTNNKTFISGGSTTGLEEQTASNITVVHSATETEITFGTSNYPLVANETYMWKAYAKK